MLLVFDKSRLVADFIELIDEFQLLFRKLVACRVYQHILVVVVGEGALALDEVILSAQTCRNGGVKHERLRYGQEKVKSTSAVVHEQHFARNVGGTVRGVELFGSARNIGNCLVSLSEFDIVR